MIGGYKGSNDYVVAAIRGDGDAVITALPLLRRMQAGGELRILADFPRRPPPSPAPPTRPASANLEAR